MNTQPTNAPGGIYRFDDPSEPNWIGVRGDQVEIRVHFPFKQGAWRDDGWKVAPKLKAIRVKYRKPIEVRQHEEMLE